MTVPVPDSKLAGEARRILESLGVDARRLKGAGLVVHSPIDGRPLATLDEATVADAKAAVGRAHAAFLKWRSVPAPRRGELVRLLGEELRAAKAELGRLVTIEVGKVESEGLGEVQEMIDICDFAVGLSRQLYGLTIQSERPDHKLVEAWRPAGVVGVISAFNFPVAVWSWNAALAFVCGDAVVWKPSEKAPLSALAVEALFRRAAAKFGPDAPDDLLTVLICGARGRRGAGRRRARAGAFGDRLDPHGPDRRRAAGAPLRPRHSRTRRQQRLDRHAVGRSRPDAARRRLRRDGHRRPALHLDAPPDRP